MKFDENCGRRKAWLTERSFKELGCTVKNVGRDPLMANVSVARLKPMDPHHTLSRLGWSVLELSVNKQSLFATLAHETLFEPIQAYFWGSR